MQFLKTLTFDQCQLCSEQFDYKDPRLAMTYERYIRHLKRKCPNVKKLCPFECSDTIHFEKDELKDHLMFQECSEYYANCIHCRGNVRIGDRLSHTCTLERLYYRMKDKIINLQVS